MKTNNAAVLNISLLLDIPAVKQDCAGKNAVLARRIRRKRESFIEVWFNDTGTDWLLFHGDGSFFTPKGEGKFNPALLRDLRFGPSCDSPRSR